MQRTNTFNLVRLLAAAGVVISHSYALLGQAEPLKATIGYTLGTACVYVFFAVSGYLIYQSFERSSLSDFIAARALRIFPGLIGACLFCLLVIGPIFTTAPDYIGTSQTWSYLPKSLILPPEPANLPGLFIDSLHPWTNGPLWTLHYEVTCYAVLAVCGLIGFRYFPAYLAGFAFLLAVTQSQYFIFGLPFIAGAAMAHYRINPSPLSVLALVAGAALLGPSSAGKALSCLALSSVAISVGRASIPHLMKFNRVGDYSYGLYIFAWPVQQVLVLIGVANSAVLAVFSLSVTLCLAFASWHLIERPALAIKGKKPHQKLAKA